MPKDLRSFLSALVAAQPGALKRVGAEVDPRFGITAYGARYEQARQYPALLFDRVRGGEVPCLTNLTATHERLALALGVEVDALTRASAHGQSRQPHPPVTVAARTRR